MSNQPTNIGSTLGSLGGNARVLAGFVALAAGVLATGTAVTVAGGSDTTVASHTGSILSARHPRRRQVPGTRRGSGPSAAAHTPFDQPGRPDRQRPAATTARLVEYDAGTTAPVIGHRRMTSST